MISLGYINQIVTKANKTLGFICYSLYPCMLTKHKNLADMALVRSCMEYCRSVWDPYTNELTQRLGAVQNRAACFVTGNESRKYWVVISWK